jgi:hypothetical protein
LQQLFAVQHFVLTALAAHGFALILPKPVFLMQRQQGFPELHLMLPAVWKHKPVHRL